MIECVPNISEGRDQKIITEVVNAVRAVPGVRLLHVDSNPDANRTVVTFVGESDSVGEGAFQLIRRAAELIDMRTQKGGHPRLGATDVCPFVPLGEETMKTCERIAEALGQRVAEELGIPVYLYEHAAKSRHRRILSDIRRGEYEGLPKRLKDPAWQPDFGSGFNEKAGATIIGARELLVAFNLNLNTNSLPIARAIAAAIRERPGGKLLVGEKELPACHLAMVRAIGWAMPGFGHAQISTNLTDFKCTGMFEVYETCKKLAALCGVEITGCELVGLLPLAAILAAANEIAVKTGQSPQNIDAKLELAVSYFGLRQTKPFRPQEHILDFCLENSLTA